MQRMCAEYPPALCSQPTHASSPSRLKSCHHLRALGLCALGCNVLTRFIDAHDRRVAKAGWTDHRLEGPWRCRPVVLPGPLDERFERVELGWCRAAMCRQHVVMEPCDDTRSGSGLTLLLALLLVVEKLINSVAACSMGEIWGASLVSCLYMQVPREDIVGDRVKRLTHGDVAWWWLPRIDDMSRLAAFRQNPWTFDAAFRRHEHAAAGRAVRRVAFPKGYRYLPLNTRPEVPSP